MVSLRSALTNAALLVNIASLGLLGYIIAGFSLSEDVVRNSYWIYAEQPDWETTRINTRFGDDFFLSTTPGKLDYSVELFYGLRMYVADCEGSQCNFDTETYRWQSCDYDDDAGPFKDSDVCKSCRFGGQAMGSYAIWCLFLMVPATWIISARVNVQKDNIALRMSGVALHTVILMFLTVGIVLFMIECYNNLSDLYSNDDIVDGDEVKYQYGPALIVSITVTGFQPLLIILHAIMRHKPIGGYEPNISSSSAASSSRKSPMTEMTSI